MDMENKLPFERIKRKILVKKEAETDGKYGCNPEERKTEEIINYGVVNVDKPKGPTSHQVSDYVQRILGLKKAGHSGTLDPAVTGVLPIALGRATKVVQALLTAGKEYIGVMHLHKEAEEKILRETIKKYFDKNPIIIKNPKKAFEYAKKVAGKKDLVLIAGSIFLVGELM